MFAYLRCLLGFHPWNKWEKHTGRSRNTYFGRPVSDWIICEYQERSCIRCGRIEKEIIG